MKQLNPARLSLFFRRLLFSLIILSAAVTARSQCPIPYPKGDLYSTLRNTPIATVVTSNDITSFGNGASLVPDTLYVSSAPGHGIVTVLNDSTILYTPLPGYTGTDFYTYTVCNACGNCAQASVSVEVKAYCPAPLPLPDIYTIYNNVPDTLPVTANDINIAGGPLTVTVRQQPRHGTATVAGGQIVYRGDGTYTGLDTLVYMVCDSCAGHSCDTAYVYLSVNTCTPVSAVNDAATVQQGNTTTLNVLANDANVTGFGTATVALLNGPKYGGTVTPGAAGLVTYLAGGGGSGIDTIAYQVCTNCGCDTGYAIFTVTQAPCRRPTAVADNIYAGYSATCRGTYDIIGNDIIPINGGSVTITIVTPPSYGTAAIVNNQLVYTCTDSTRRGLGDLIRYSICNACLCDTGVVNIHITNYVCNGLNPLINKDTAYVCRNYPVSIPVTANDIDPEGSAVTVDAVVGAAQHGTAVKSSATTVRYTPAANFTGHDFFVYQACDSGIPKLCNIATVDVYVADCNRSPVIVDAGGRSTDTLRVAVIEDSSLVYCINFNQPDSPYAYIAQISASADTVTSVSGIGVPVTSPACVRIAPPTDSRAEQTVQVIICNSYPLCDTVQVIISILAINHAPVAVYDSIRYGWPDCNLVNVLRNDSDRDAGDHLSITHYDAATAHGGTVSQLGDSSLCYTPDSLFAGLDTFAYTVCDTSHVCVTSYVVVFVPARANNDQAATSQDQSVSVNVILNDTRAPGEYLTVCNNAQHGTVTLDSTTITYTPAHDYPINPLSPDTTIGMGLDSFCYTLCNVSGLDTFCTTAEVYVSISPKAKFYIPQGISPNGDGVNDKFVVVSSDEFPKSQLLVYNRYGDEVWRNDTDGYMNDFDGTWKKNGQPLPDMSYWYIFKFNDGRQPDRMGYIIIER